jgi:hypothetical protein
VGVAIDRGEGEMRCPKCYSPEVTRVISQEVQFIEFWNGDELDSYETGEVYGTLNVYKYTCRYCELVEEPTAGDEEEAAVMRWHDQELGG